MASVVVPPTVLSTHQRRDAVSEPIETPTTMDAMATSPLSVWWKTEPRVDLWASAGAFALGLACVLAVVLF